MAFESEVHVLERRTWEKALQGFGEQSSRGLDVCSVRGGAQESSASVRRVFKSFERVFRWWSWSSFDEELLDGVFVVVRGALEEAGRTTEGAR